MTNTHTPAEVQPSQLHHAAYGWLCKLNETVPFLAPVEFLHARQKLVLLVQLTHPARTAPFLPNPLTFGSDSAAREVEDAISSVSAGLTLAGLRKTDPELDDTLTAAANAVIRLNAAYLRRLPEGSELGQTQQVPLLVPPGFLPQVNHYSRWVSSDGVVDFEQFANGPKPIIPGRIN